MKKLTIGVIGAGAARGQWWIGTIAKLRDHLELIGICETVVERHEENRRRWQVPVYSSLNELIDARKPDLVLCAVPPDGNPAIAHIAARHGIHVVSEIPVAPTRRLAESMDRVAQENGVKLEIAENVYRWPLERLKQRIIAAGAVGDIELIRLSYITGSYHGFNAVRALMGCEATRVLGFARDLHFPFHDDYMNWDLQQQRWGGALIEFENGAACWYEKPVHGGCARQYWDVEGTEGNLTPDGLEPGKGAPPDLRPFQFEYQQVNGEQIIESIRVDTDPPIVYENPYRGYGIGTEEDQDAVARAEILVRFCRAIVEDEPVDYPPLRAWGDQELVVAVEQSQRSGNQWVTLPLSDDCEVLRDLERAYSDLYGCEATDVDAMVAMPLPRGGVRCSVLGDT